MIIDDVTAYLQLQKKNIRPRSDTATTVEKNFVWANEFITQHLTSRIARAKDVVTDEVRDAQQLAKRYIGEGYQHFFATCIDGRNLPAVMLSAPPHVIRALRAPAGIIPGILESSQAHSVVIDESFFVIKQIKKLLKEYSGETIFYDLDSHVGCAARNLIHTSEGGSCVDMGLRSDIKAKLMTAKALQLLESKLKHSGQKSANIIPTVFSYDPATGGIILGLEIYIDSIKIKEEGYTAHTLQLLAEQGLILRATDLLQDTQVLHQLLYEQVTPHSSDFRNEYGRTMKTHWEIIWKLYAGGNGYLFQYLYKKVLDMYLHGGWHISKDGVDNLEERVISTVAIEHKAKLLLQNIVTRYSMCGADSSSWEFDTHHESMIAITDSGYAPFNDPHQDAFSISTRDILNLPQNVKLAIDLIRTFRANGHTKNVIPGIYETKEEFVQAPVLVAHKVVLRNISTADWQAIQNISLEKKLLEIDWDKPEVLHWQYTDFAEFIAPTLANVSFTVGQEYTKVLNDAFDKARRMMNDKMLRKMLLHGNLLLVTTIVDEHRMPRVFVPFVF